MKNRDIDIGWAAGLFEGEGSIRLSRGMFISLKLGMTDRDVVERFKDIVECGQIYMPEPKGSYKPFFEWSVGRRTLVEEIMEAFLPHLGARRRARWLEVVAIRDSRLGEQTCPECKKTFKPIRGGQVCCGHDCSWRHSRKVGKYTNRAGHGRTRDGYSSDWNRKRALGPPS